MELEELLTIAKRSFPPASGTVALDGLKGDVDVAWDTWGVPHVRAASTTDAWFIQGYIHAQHRLFQMDMMRRKYRGRLAEVAGPAAIDSDKHARTIGFGRLADRDAARLEDEHARGTLDGTGRAIILETLEAYCNGVNAGIAWSRDHPPVELVILDIQPGPWTIADVLLVPHVLDWMESSWQVPVELVREHLIAKLGRENAEKVIPLHDGTSTESARGSNAWALSPSRTGTGGAILCSDPHLALGLPCIWFEMQLSCPGLNVAGVSIPGAPGIIIGHNEHIGWGITNVQGDTQDLFKIDVIPGDGTKYIHDGKVLEMNVIEECIRIKDDQPVRYNIRVTCHGPVIEFYERFNDVEPIPVEGHFALRWSAQDKDAASSLLAFFLVNQAKDWEDFRLALAFKQTCPHNFIYADVRGNIGHQVAGVLPIRNRGTGTSPSPGSCPDFEWTSYAPFDSLKSIHNPSCGHVYTANYNENPVHNGILIAMDMIGEHRQARLEELLESKQEITFEDCISFQLDNLSIEARTCYPEMLERLKKHHLLDEIIGLPRDAIQAMESWDFRIDKGSIAASIYVIWRNETQQVVLSSILDEPFASMSVEVPPFTLERMFDLLLDGDGERIASALKQGLERAVAYLAGKKSPDTSRWTWGNVHALTLVHPFATANPDAKMLNMGPFKVHGDRHTLNNGHYDASKDYAMVAGPSYRQVLDLSDWDKSIAVIPGGQSGLPFHVHYNDLIKLWTRGKYHPMLFLVEKIAEHLESTQRFTPLVDK